MQNAYNTLVAWLYVDKSDTSTMSADGAIKSALQSPPISAPMLLNMDSPPQLDHADYAKTHCWTKEDWKRWCMTPEGQGANSQTSFLEDKNGEVLPAARITNILQAMSDEKVASFAKHKMKTEMAENAVSPTPKWPKLPLGSQSLTEGDGSASDSEPTALDMPPLSTSNNMHAPAKSTCTGKPTASDMPPLSTGKDVHAPGMSLGLVGNTVDQGDASIPPPASLIKNPLLSVSCTPSVVDNSPPQQNTMLDKGVTPASGSNDSINREHEDNTGTEASAITAQASMQTGLGQAPQPKGVMKKTWHPPSNKSARTLCMHRYQKQIGSSLEEFNSYYDTLSADQKAKYKDEATKLTVKCIKQGHETAILVWWVMHACSNGYWLWFAWMEGRNGEHVYWQAVVWWQWQQQCEAAVAIARCQNCIEWATLT
ncbi:hypothetical protein BKA82DRAFT_8046 [Pisolithus tinctorius]|uniref:Uncharacterized protein n=1 Tax=Pisolithus tinctorius Marx 270 TaxID=870435 RepID=A0A0C3PKI5_PISTI|nr:hypothetical protein BKA82DRAFT_8046 [Pisolithus tinctorius]KIO08754.1 hypothetical protein M404DRAFT_8046 [Pisolithus tinctorius Marx 270]